MYQNESEYQKQIDEVEINKNISIGDSNNNQTESEQNDNIKDHNNKPQILENNINNDNNNSIINNTTEENISENIENNNIMINHINNSQENNNNNNIQNINNHIIDDSINIPPVEEEPKPYNPKLTFSFKIFFILNTLSYIQSFYKLYDLKKYTLCLWPIINKYQYYRLITNHFYHLGFFDYLITMIGLFFATKYLEREIGSIYLILIIFYGIIMSSILYIIVIWMFKTILRFSEYNFIYQCGFSSIDFCLYLSYFLLKKNYNNNIDLSFIELRGLHSVYFAILIFQLITPSASIIINISGVFSASLIYRYIKFFGLPRNYWINDIEKLFGLNKINNCQIKCILGYISINENDIIKNNVKEFDYFLDNINKQKKNIKKNDKNNVNKKT